MRNPTRSRLASKGAEWVGEVPANRYTLQSRRQGAHHFPMILSLVVYVNQKHRRPVLSFAHGGAEDFGLGHQVIGDQFLDSYDFLDSGIIQSKSDTLPLG